MPRIGLRRRSGAGPKSPISLVSSVQVQPVAQAALAAGRWPLPRRRVLRRLGLWRRGPQLPSRLKFCVPGYRVWPLYDLLFPD